MSVQNARGATCRRPPARPRAQQDRRQAMIATPSASARRSVC